MNRLTPAEMAKLLPPGAHGGEAALLAQVLGVDPSAVLDLSASLNPFAPDVVGMTGSYLDEIRRYPNPDLGTRLLAEAINVPHEHLLLTNGGSEAIALVAAEMRVGSIDEPEFSLYRRHLDAVDETGLRWRSNPHNPSGLLARMSETADVWDEAFYPLCTGSWTRGDRGCVVLGSLTKLFGCPGLRLGYVLSDQACLIAKLARRQPQWSVNSLALAVLPQLLEAAELVRWARDLTKLREELVSMLVEHGFAPSASDASWVLVPRAGDLRARLAGEAILVRDCSSFGIHDTVRIAVPSPEGLERFARALRTIKVH